MSTGSSVANVDDPNYGKPFLKLLLNASLLFGDIASILFLVGCASLYGMALIAVWALLGVFTGLFMLFTLVLFVVALFLVIYLIYKLYPR